MVENKKAFNYGERSISIEKCISYNGTPVIHVVTDITGVDKEFDINFFSIKERDEVFQKMDTRKTKEMVCGLIDYWDKEELDNDTQTTH